MSKVSYGVESGLVSEERSNEHQHMISRVDLALIRDNLAELSSEEEQRRLWLSDGQHGRDVGSFIEAFCGLFDDSRLGDELEGGGSVFDTATDADLRRLGSLLARIDHQRPPCEIIADPRMTEVRLIATRLLGRIDNLGTRPPSPLVESGLR
jgi:hypothetical protein